MLGYKIPSPPALAGGCAGSPSSRSVSTLAGRGSEHACWSLEALIKSRLYQKSPRNFQRAEETESSRSKEAPGRVFGAGRDVAFSEGIVPVRQPGLEVSLLPVGSQRKAHRVRQKRGLEGKRRFESEGAAWRDTQRTLGFWSIAPWHMWVQILRFPCRLPTPCKMRSCAITAPWKTPRSRGGFCYPSVVLFGKQGSDCRYFPCL